MSVKVMSERGMLLRKIEEWRLKAHRESDPFDKYISLFIAYNIFYNLYKKTRNPLADLSHGDRDRAIEVLSLINERDAYQLFYSIQSDLEEYISIIPIFREEYWPSNRARNKVAISEALKEAYKEGNARKIVEMLLKWLYKVRCNLVHGEKEYNSEAQNRLLSKSSILLDKILQYLLEKYRQLYQIGEGIEPEIWRVGQNRK